MALNPARLQGRMARKCRALRLFGRGHYGISGTCPSSSGRLLPTVPAIALSPSRGRESYRKNCAPLGRRVRPGSRLRGRRGSGRADAGGVPQFYVRLNQVVA